MTIPRATTIEELLEQIRQAAKDSDYIFRGESSDKYPSYPKVTSTLYRVYQTEIDAKHFEIDVVEKEVADKVRKHDHDLEKDSNDTILEKLQHYGGKTNQIDFSANCWVALFFSCYGKYEDDGRVILQNKKEVRTHKPTNPKNRVAAQESIFVRSSDGFIEPNEDKVIVVPSEFKKDALEYLSKECNINAAKIYNDIYGYIAQAEIHKSAYIHFYRGLTYQSKDEIDEAIKAYTDAIELNPNMAEVHNNRGGMYATKNHHDLALALVDFSKAIELNPGHAKAYSNRGNTYNEMSKPDLAIADCNKAIELNPNMAEAYNNRGYAYRRKGKYDLAIADYTKAIELEPNFAETYSNRGNAHCKKDDYDLAIADYTKAIELDPKFAGAYNNRGNTYNDMGEYDFAIADCNKAIELDPKFARAYNNRGIGYGKNKYYDLAIDDYIKAIELDPNFASAYLNRGNICGSIGEHSVAIVDFNKAIELNPNYVEAYANRSMTKIILKDNQGAQEDLETAIRLAEQQGNKPFAVEIQKKTNEFLAALKK